MGRFSKQDHRSQRDRGKNRKHVLSKAPMRSARELLPAVTVPLTNVGDRYLTCCSSVSQMLDCIACSRSGTDGPRSYSRDVKMQVIPALHYPGILSMGIAERQMTRSCSLVLRHRKGCSIRQTATSYKRSIRLMLQCSRSHSLVPQPQPRQPNSQKSITACTKPPSYQHRYILRFSIQPRKKRAAPQTRGVEIPVSGSKPAMTSRK